MAAHMLIMICSINPEITARIIYRDFCYRDTDQQTHREYATLALDSRGSPD
jgi:hypothetical protein